MRSLERAGQSRLTLVAGNATATSCTKAVIPHDHEGFFVEGFFPMGITHRGTVVAHRTIPMAEQKRPSRCGRCSTVVLHVHSDVFSDRLEFGIPIHRGGNLFPDATRINGYGIRNSAPVPETRG